jgi:RHS repeat-associated protein
MREIMLCRYSYDPLDRLVGTLPLSDAESRRFYCKNLLATEIQGAMTYSIFQHEDRLLAQQQNNETSSDSTLLVTDQQRSVLRTLSKNALRPIAYSPYGHRTKDTGLLRLLGFNGEQRDPVSGHYLLGNGYRAFNPVLMRFNSPDSWSPFANGGINPYAYCEGDPVNEKDPSGHSPLLKAYMMFIQRSSLKSSNVFVATASIIAKTPTPADAFNGIIARVSKSFTPQQRAIIKSSERFSKSKKLLHQISPGKRRSAEKSTSDFNFYNQHGEKFNFKNGVPQAGEIQTAPNGRETYLHTGHFDASINYYAHKVATSPAHEQKMAANNLRQSVFNRAEYIVRHSQELARDSIRAPRGNSPVR